MSSAPTDVPTVLGDVRAALLDVADPVDAEPMAKYMRHRFPFLGAKTPARRRSTAPILRPLRSAPVDVVIDVVGGLWEEPEREFHQVGADLLADHARRLGPSQLPAIRRFLTTNAWWDTVDSIAIGTVGTMARPDGEVVTEVVDVMDEWIELDDDTSDAVTSEMWLARTAILHQLQWKDDTDEDRLFRYALRRSSDTQFFLRKAIGWALRQYARTEPGAVRSFVDAHRDVLSPLTVREATKHL